MAELLSISSHETILDEYTAMAIYRLLGLIAYRWDKLLASIIRTEDLEGLHDNARVMTTECPGRRR